jgi:hypothetical protein
MLASSEGDDAADRVVWGNPDGHAISGHHLDSKAAHPAAQLRKYLVSLVALHTVKAAAVNRHDSALHVNQIVLAQVLSFPSKIVPRRRGIKQTQPLRARTPNSTSAASFA